MAHIAGPDLRGAEDVVGVSYELRNLIHDAKTPDLSGVQKAVLYAYARHVNADDVDQLSWPSAEGIAATTGFGEKSVRRSIVELVERGYLLDRGYKHRKRCYAVRFPAVPPTPPWSQRPKYFGHSDRQTDKGTDKRTAKSRTARAASTSNFSESNAGEIWAYYRDCFPPGATDEMPSPRQQKVIAHRLREGYSVEEIKTAIVNAVDFATGPFGADAPSYVRDLSHLLHEDRIDDSIAGFDGGWHAGWLDSVDADYTYAGAVEALEQSGRRRPRRRECDWCHDMYVEAEMVDGFDGARLCVGCVGWMDRHRAGIVAAAEGSHMTLPNGGAA